MDELPSCYDLSMRLSAAVLFALAALACEASVVSPECNIVEHCSCILDRPHPTALAQQVRAGGGVVFVGSAAGDERAAPPEVDSAPAVCDVYRAVGFFLDDLHVIDALGADLDATVVGLAVNGPPYWATETGDPHPAPPDAAPCTCPGADDPYGFGVPGTTYVYFAHSYRDAWYVSWRAEVRDGMVDVGGTYDGGAPSVTDIPVDDLRLPAP
ncbi:MAG: hypothetical protein DRJ42_01780 [Deltaproteobacteria bacterium]|nr:MAG: hypothetical protein DRJ42_01780 [Deltaproteobacteria bacterium]